MLYVSRFVSFLSWCDESRSVDYGEMKYGVVDTDDYQEEIVSYAVLTKAVFELGIPILGVERVTYANRSTGIEVTPYQDDRYCTRLMVKTKTVLGVDIRVFNGEITAILINESVMRDGVRVKLSDFGDKITVDTMLRCESVEPDDKSLIVELDDDVHVVGNIYYHNLPCVWFDVSNMSNVDFVRDCFGPKLSSAENCIIDSKGRIGRLSLD